MSVYGQHQWTCGRCGSEGWAARATRALTLHQLRPCCAVRRWKKDRRGAERRMYEAIMRGEVPSYTPQWRDPELGAT